MSGATERRQIRKDEAMRFMLLQNYGEVESDCAPMTEWAVANPRHIKGILRCLLTSEC
ncbi:MAG: hypothetical protein JJD93_00985 [Ilumatobacteraceae bacterium]|nr:hypothetical protein [Ilumatobacteraceae bacterium]